MGHRSDAQLTDRTTDRSEKLLRKSAAKMAILEQVARGSTLQDVLGQLLDYIEEFATITNAWVVVVDPQTQELCKLASRRAPAFVIDMIESPSAHRSQCYNAAIKGKREVISDVIAEPAPALEPQQLVQHEMLSGCSEPIPSPFGEPLGALSVYFPAIDAVNECALRIISDAAVVAGVAIERERQTQRLQQLNKALDQRVQERTRELHDTVLALEQARAEAVKATNVKTRFLAAASHDLRQPLQAISLYLSLFLRPLLPDSREEIQMKLESSVESMTEILDSLLDITHISSGKIDSSKTVIELQDVFDRLNSGYSAIAAERRLQLIVVPTNARLETNPQLLARILDNLIRNAISYTNTGYVKLSCHKHGDNYRISVEDTGIGIPATEIDSIFEEYRQLNNPARHHSKGKGLGLAVVKQLCTLLEHPLDVTSTPGKGSTFSIIVPRSEQLPESHNSDARTATQSPEYLAQQQVLIVDDEPAVLDSLSAVLSSSNLAVTTAESAELALQHLNGDYCPDVLISDFHLPDMDGATLIGKARSRLDKTLPAILLTGDTHPDSRAAPKPPDTIIVIKPASARVLLETIDKLNDRLDDCSVLPPSPRL